MFKINLLGAKRLTNEWREFIAAESIYHYYNLCKERKSYVQQCTQAHGIPTIVHIPSQRDEAITITISESREG